MSAAELQALLTEGKPNSKGHADEVALYILQNGPETLAALWPCLYHEYPGMRSRAAHVVEAVAEKQPGWLKSYHEEILKHLALPELDPAFNFFIPSLLGLLPWTDEEVPIAVDRLQYWLLNLNHQFVKVFCLQSLTDLAIQQPWLKHEVQELVHQHMAKGGKAINARGRMLLKTMAKG